MIVCSKLNIGCGSWLQHEINYVSSFVMPYYPNWAIVGQGEDLTN